MPCAGLTWQMQASGAGERAGAAGTAGRGALEQKAVVGAAQQLVLPQRELVAGQQLAAAHGAAEALDVVHAVPRPHHQVAAAEAHLALGALDAEQPAGPHATRVSSAWLPRRPPAPLPDAPKDPRHARGRRPCSAQGFLDPARGRAAFSPFPTFSTFHPPGPGLT